MKKVYVKPILKVLGNMQRLTQTTNGGSVCDNSGACTNKYA